MTQPFGPHHPSCNLYTNTVLDGSVTLSVILSVCPFAIETTFPLSNFKTKHIFGILKTLRKFLKLWGVAGAPIYFSVTAAEGAAPLVGERNLTEGGCFASVYT